MSVIQYPQLKSRPLPSMQQLAVGMDARLAPQANTGFSLDAVVKHDSTAAALWWDLKLIIRTLFI